MFFIMLVHGRAAVHSYLQGEKKYTLSFLTCWLLIKQLFHPLLSALHTDFPSSLTSELLRSWKWLGLKSEGCGVKKRTYNVLCLLAVRWYKCNKTGKQFQYYRCIDLIVLQMELKKAKHRNPSKMSRCGNMLSSVFMKIISHNSYIHIISNIFVDRIIR